MARGRPPLGPNIVQRFDADPHAKLRLAVLLETLSGQLPVPDACRKLGISQARFFELRSTMLHAALESLEPKPAGRPIRPADPENERVTQLERQVTDLRVHLAAAQIREEIALAMPHLARRRQANRKKTPLKTTPPITARSLAISPSQIQSSGPSPTERLDT